MKYTSRKFILSILSILLLTLLLSFEKLPAATFENLFGLVISAYMIGNVSQRYIEKDK